MSIQKVVAILEANNSTELIKALYEEKKAGNQRFSLGTFSRLTGISSRGYLSDVIHGARKLSIEHLDAVCEVFELGGLGKKYFRLLLEAERERSYSARREKLKEAKALCARLEEKAKPIALYRLAIELYCFTKVLFRGDIGIKELLKGFEPEAQVEIEKALGELKKKGAIVGGRGTMVDAIFALSPYVSDTQKLKAKESLYACVTMLQAGLWDLSNDASREILMDPE